MYLPHSPSLHSESAPLQLPKVEQIRIRCVCPAHISVHARISDQVDQVGVELTEVRILFFLSICLYYLTEIFIINTSKCL